MSAPRKICVLNYKGGTGKTSIVVNLAYKLAQKKNKVLIVDLDPQGSSGYHLGIQSDYTLYDLLIGAVSASDCIVQARPNLDIIVSNERLFPAELSMSAQENRESILSQRLAEVTDYDYIILDCAPSINLLNQNALVFCDEVFLPVSMEYLSLPGIVQLLNNIKLINKIFKRSINISKIIPNFYNKRNKKSQNVLNSLNRTFPGKVASPIRLCVSVSEAAGYKQSVFEYAEKSNGAADFEKLTKEVLA